MPIADVVLDTPTCGGVSLPVNPFVSNRYHFGMLLGVADLETDQGYHRGKGWLHNAWLHGEGAVWGLRVEVRADANEVVIHPGLALDRNGRELRVTDRLCLDLGRWYAERRPDDLVVEDDGNGGVLFDLHVTLCAEECLDRPVPSISEPCEGSDLGTAYSRAVEQPVAALVAGRAPAAPAEQYPRLRQFFGHAAVADVTVVEALDAIDAAPAGDRAATCVAWFRTLAALDTMDLQPEDGPGALFPAADDNACIVLADIRAHLRPDRGRWMVVGEDAHSHDAGHDVAPVVGHDVGHDVAHGEPTTVDNTIRPSHVRTRTIQELCGHAHGRGPTAPDQPGPVRLVAASLRLHERTVTLRFTEPVDPATVSKRAFTASTLRDAGWTVVTVDDAVLDADAMTTTITLKTAPSGRLVRVIAHGTGATPILGVDGRPLAGLDVDARTSASGEDAAVTITTTPTDDPSDPHD